MVSRQSSQQVFLHTFLHTAGIFHKCCFHHAIFYYHVFTPRTNTRRRDPSPWMRLPGQVCKVPNEACLTLSSGRKGCYFIQFSPDGHFLACGCKENETYPIMVYEVNKTDNISPNEASEMLYFRILKAAIKSPTLTKPKISDARWKAERHISWTLQHNLRTVLVKGQQIYCVCLL